MSYKAGIVKAISELKDRTGSSSIAIKKHMQANLPADKKWVITTFLKALKNGVAAGEFVQTKSSYKLSASFKKKVKSAAKPKILKISDSRNSPRSMMLTIQQSSQSRYINMEKLTAANEDLKTAHDTREHVYKATIDMLNSEEKQLLDRLQALDAKKLEVAKANGDVDITDGDLVEINVGGKIIAVTRATLTQFKGTRLEALFSGRWDKKLQKDSAGRIFLDVNPLCFQAIVDYLNEVKISSEQSPAAPPTVDAEYQDILMHQLDLFGLSEIVFPVELLDSKVIQQLEHCKLLHGWLEEDSSDGKLCLLYRSSRDGRCDSTFHNKCDSMGPTLTVIGTTDGHIIGGYTDVNWESISCDQWDYSNKAFLFAISKSGAFVSSKMKLKNNGKRKYAIYNRSKYGPTFGEGHDLQVEGSNVYMNTGYTYHSAPVPNNTFPIKEMEVFQVTQMTGNPKHKKHAGNHAANTPNKAQRLNRVESFCHSINTAINKKWTALAEVEQEVAVLEASFKDEGKFIKFVSSGKDEDIIALNVCGMPMTTTRQTIQVCKDAKLASKILESNQDDDHTPQKPVREWNTEDVVAWLNTIDGLSPSIVSSFECDEVTGRELLALGCEDLNYFGITKRGAIAYFLSEVKKLEKARGENALLIEHSPYCFEKIIDHLRLESMFVKGLVETKPGMPNVKAAEKSRFEKVVKHYFPGDSSKALLGK